MKGCEAMDVEKLINLLMLSLAQATAITFLVYLLCVNSKVVALEHRVWASFKRWLRRQLRKSPRIVAWAEKPTKHGRPDEEWITGQIRVWGEWK
jgi:hypothetical protein